MLILRCNLSLPYQSEAADHQYHDDQQPRDKIFENERSLFAIITDAQSLKSNAHQRQVVIRLSAGAVFLYGGL